MRLGFLALLFSGCASWQKPYTVRGEPNLTANIQMDEHFLTGNHAEFELYEELPECQRLYLGTVELKDKTTNALALPVGRELILFFTKMSHSPAYIQSNSSSFRLRVKPGESYRLSFRERKGSQETLFQVKEVGIKAFHDLESLPDRNCEQIKVINIK